MKTVPITHRRIATGQKPEEAAIAVSDQAAKNHAELKAAGVTLHVRQLTAEQAVDEAKGQTEGVIPSPADPSAPADQLVLVSLEHRRGTYKARICPNKAGPKSPQATAEAMLLAYTKADLVQWAQANV